MISARPEGPVLCFVGASALLASTVPRWFSVLIEYPGDQVRHDYGILALDRGSLHSYTAFGWAFELLIALAPVPPSWRLSTAMSLLRVRRRQGMP